MRRGWGGAAGPNRDATSSKTRSPPQGAAEPGRRRGSAPPRRARGPTASDATQPPRAEKSRRGGSFGRSVGPPGGCGRLGGRACAPGQTRRGRRGAQQVTLADRLSLLRPYFAPVPWIHVSDYCARLKNTCLRSTLQKKLSANFPQPADAPKQTLTPVADAGVT